MTVQPDHATRTSRRAARFSTAGCGCPSRGATRRLARLAVWSFCVLTAQAWAADAGGPVAKISFPPPDALVRANVPVFGVADAPSFRRYRLEHGAGDEPTEWHVIRTSHEPRPVDPWAEREVVWDPNSGAHGNLGDWASGLSSYAYGREVVGLNGVQTLRLIVEDESGATAEARVRVTVGRVITREKGGWGASSDGRVHFEARSGSIGTAFLLVSVQPIKTSEDKEPRKAAVAAGLVPVGPIYEFRPPGTVFESPLALRMKYQAADLAPAGLDGGKPARADRLAVCMYSPMWGGWRPLAGASVAERERVVSAPVMSVPPGRAFVAIMSDRVPPEPPALELVSQSPTGLACVAGRTEPLAVVRLSRGDDAVAEVRAGGDGRFRVNDVKLATGRNALFAHALDAVGNVSLRSAVLDVEHDDHSPVRMHGITAVGGPTVGRGERILVRADGEDAHPGVNVCRATVRSDSDPAGFELPLVETGAATGVYVGVVRIGAQTEEIRRVIGARRDGERIVVSLIGQEGDRAVSVRYQDNVPPSVPVIQSSTHPSVCQDVFEDAARAPGDWRGIDGPAGARVAWEQPTPDWPSGHLSLTKQRDTGHLGALATDVSFSARRFPLVSFDYCIDPDVRMDMELLTRDGWRLVSFCDPDGEHPRYGRTAVGAFPDVVNDGRWRHAELDISEALDSRGETDPEQTVRSVRFVNWDQKGLLRLEFGRTGAKGARWRIDNFRILGHGPDEAVLAWSSHDDSDVVGYSYVLDRAPDTTPEERVMTPATGRRWPHLADGRWFLHVRACDTHGNWSRSAHHMFAVDSDPPKATVLRSAETRRPWDGAVEFRLSDGDGAGVDPRSLRVKAGGREYDLGSRALAYAASTGTLTFRPGLGDEPLRLPRDGEEVSVELAALADRAGHSMENPVEFRYRVQSPLRLSPAECDGRDGWYVSMPEVRLDVPPGRKAEWRWSVRPEEDPSFAGGASLHALEVTLTDEGGAVRQFLTPIKVDSRIPHVTSSIRAIWGRKYVVLTHDDVALQGGGLECTMYDGAAPHPNVLRSLDQSDWRTVEMHPDAESVVWRGAVLSPAGGATALRLTVGEKQRVAVTVAGQTVLKAGSLFGYETESAEAPIDLQRTMTPLDIRWESRTRGARPDIDLTWTNGDRQEPIPARALFSPRSLARIHWWWDGHSAVAQEYRDPIPVPHDARVLNYYAVNEAGTRSPTVQREVSGF